MPGPIFCEGDVVSLRTLEKDDAEWNHELVNDPRVWQSLGMEAPVSLEETHEWIDSKNDSDAVCFVVTVDETPVGTVNMKAPYEMWGIAELSYKFDPEHWGNGYATDALKTISAYAFETRRLEKLFAECFDTNPASGRALEKAGFSQEGRFKNHGFTAGERVDVLRYGLLATEWFDRE